MVLKPIFLGFTYLVDINFLFHVQGGVLKIMNNLICRALLLLTGICITSNAFAEGAALDKKNILDYFREINHPLLSRSLEATKKQEGGLVTKAQVLDAKLNAARLTVDIPNYFIQIDYHGSSGHGERYSFMQYALYSPDKNPIFAISCNSPDDTFIAFLTERNGEWGDITNEIFPKIQTDTYAENPANLKDKSWLMQWAYLQHHLPREGTSIRVTLNINESGWMESDSQKDATVNARQETLQKAVAPLTYREVELSWIKGKRRFQIAKKMKR